MKVRRWKTLSRLVALLKPPRLERAHRIRRLRSVERNIVLPVKAVLIGVLFYNFNFTPWFTVAAMPSEIAQFIVVRFFSIYAVLNVAVAVLLLQPRRLPLTQVQRVIFGVAFLDGLFLAALTLVTGGFDSILYWAFLGLIVRNALSNPLATPQIILNLSASFCYLIAGLLDVGISQEIALLEESDRPDTPFSDVTEPAAEPFLLRLIVLWMMTACCYGVQVLFDKGRQAIEEAREFGARQEQLRAAGRLAAGIAHQIKNPLGIINNAAFSLQRQLEEGKKLSAQQLQIIREEVDRSDRIITELMGYAQLAEGQVEKLSVIYELNRAINEVFPPGAYYGIQVETDFDENLPALLMQRQHLSEIFINILQNAREALGRQGRVQVRAEAADESAVTVRIKDDGPGIAREMQNKIFQPYFTTKEKGTGLGLAIVQQNAGIYGATVRVDSELGQGAEFILHFPTRTFMKLRQ